MYQTRLDSFFHASSPSPSDRIRVSLLHLPSSVRNRIYEYAGPFDRTIDLNFSNLLIYPYKQYPDRLFCARARCAHVGGEVLRGCDETAILGEEVYWEYAQQPVENCKMIASGTIPLCTSCSDGRSLMFVCRQISEEVLPLFYANNLFTVRQGAPYGLKRLSTMGPLGLKFMKSLTITLGAEDSSICPGEWWFDLPALLRNKHRSSRASLTAYEAVVERLVRHITPNRCELHIAFRVATSNLLEKVLLPLFQLPTLKRCVLCPFVGNDAPELADPPPPYMSGACFRYLELPAELRLRILGFSDLVIENGVQWRPQGHPREAVWYGDRQCDCSPELEEAGDCICGAGPKDAKLRNARLQDYKEYHCCEMCKPVSMAGLCLCSRASFPTFSSSCICRPKRHPLFCVSRQVREDAIETYYSRNRFYITPFYSTKFPYCWPTKSPKGLRNVELSLYLCSLPFNALQHIRWLEWLLPSSIDDYLHPKTRTWFDYLDVLEMMRNSMNIENLTFVLNMAGEGAPFDAYDLPYHSDNWQNERRIGLALRRLGRLKDCFIYLSRYHRDVRVRNYEKQLLEKEIMGDDYDSAARGKPLERVSAILALHGDYGI